MAMSATSFPLLSDGKLPVFVFPTSLTFLSDDQSSHKQVVTLYNPYDFSLRFKVLSTSPRKYNVVESEGTIKARCCIDIVIRHKDLSINNEGVRDKFRVQVSEQGQKTVIGRKDIPSVLLPTRDKTSCNEDHFESLPCSQKSQTSSRDLHLPPCTPLHGSLPGLAGAAERHGGGPSITVMVITLAALLALLLPSEISEHSSLPQFMCLQANHKLVAAYVLGLVTMVILRS